MAGRKPLDYRLEHYLEDVIFSGLDWLGVYRSIDDYDFSLISQNLRTYVTNSASWQVNDLSALIRFSSVFSLSSLTFHNDFVPQRDYNYVNITLNTDEIQIPIIQFQYSLDYVRFVVYGKFFRFCHIQNIYDPVGFFQKIIFFYFHFVTSSGQSSSIFDIFNPKDWLLFRADYAIDIRNITVNQYYDLLISQNSKDNISFGRKQKLYVGKNSLETFYVGSRDNDYCFSRQYDKLLDVTRTGHEVLYSDYFKNNSVTRIEFQCGRSFMGKQFNLRDIEGFYDKIRSYIGLSAIWQGKYWVGTRYDSDYIYDKPKYATNLADRMIKACKNGIDMTQVCTVVNNSQNIIYMSSSFKILQNQKKSEKSIQGQTRSKRKKLQNQKKGL